jgi:hypothetical protein
MVRDLSKTHKRGFRLLQALTLVFEIGDFLRSLGADANGDRLSGSFHRSLVVFSKQLPWSNVFPPRIVKSLHISFASLVGDLAQALLSIIYIFRAPALALCFELLAEIGDFTGGRASSRYWAPARLACGTAFLLSFNPRSGPA